MKDLLTKTLFTSLLIISMICMPSICATKEEQASGEIKIGNAPFTWKAQGPGGFRESMAEKLAPERHHENFTFSLPGLETKLQISPEGKLTITDINKEEKRVVVRDSSGGIIFDSKKQIDDISSLDEEAVELPVGGRVTLRSILNKGSITVTYDKMITLKSEKDDSFSRSVLYSKWIHSPQVKVATHSYGGGREGKNEVFLEESPAEIELLNSFLSPDKKRRKELVNELTITESVKLLVILHAHGFIKEFGYSHFDRVMGSLKNKIYSLLKQATRRDISDWSTAIPWFGKIETWSWAKRGIIEDVLRRVIGPVLTVLFAGENIIWMSFSPDGTKIIVLYTGGRWEIRDIEGEDGKVILEGEDIIGMFFSLDGTKIIVKYKGDRWEIRDIEDYNRSIIFTKLKPKELLLIFSLINSPNIDDLTTYRAAWKSLDSELKQKLKKSYLSKKVVEFLEGWVKILMQQMIKRKKIIA